MNQSESIKNLMGALLEARGNMTGAKKKGSNPHFKSTYATLEAVIEAVDEPLRAAGVNWMQLPVEGERMAGVRTILYHCESGEWISSELMLPLGKPGPQEIGSAITYAKRYTLQAMCGIPSEDDDGEAAQKAYRPQKNSTGREPKSVAQITAEESLPPDMNLARRDEYVEQIREALHLNDDHALFQLIDEVKTDQEMHLAVHSQLTGGRGGESSIIKRKLAAREEPTSSTVSTIASNEL